MKRLTVALLLLVGCAAAEREPGPTKPRHAALPAYQAADVRAAANLCTYTVFVTAAGRAVPDAIVIFRGSQVPTDATGRAQIETDWDYASVRVNAPGLAQGVGLVNRETPEATIALVPLAKISGLLRTTGGE